MAETPPDFSAPLAVQVMIEKSQDPEIQFMISVEHLIEHLMQARALDELAIRRALDHVRAKRVMAG